MDVLYERCCGLDVHKKGVVACLFKGHQKKEIRSYGTMTDELLMLVDWLQEEKCQCVAMESTGSYWKPIYNLLELEGIKAIVVNAQHIKSVPGRKTDVKDAEWIGDLLLHGLLTASFIPSRDQRELRELVRYRKRLVEERSREFNRMQKILEGANIKIGSVASSINTQSVKAMLKLMSQGVEDPEKLSVLAKGSFKSKKADIERSLKGLMADHQRMILEIMINHTEYLDALLEDLDKEVAKRMAPIKSALVALDSLPGIGPRSAEVILSEIGTDMSVFASERHISSWAGMCPGNDESAGKRKSGKTRKGNQTLRTTLVECAKAAGRTKGTYFQEQYGRIAARRGRNRAAVAVGHSMLIVIYYMLRDGTPYSELGSGYFDNLNKDEVVKRAVKKLEKQGYKVTLEQA